MKCKNRLLSTEQVYLVALNKVNKNPSFQAATHVSRARLSNGGSRVLAWMKPLDARERCATLGAPRASPVARQRPGYATLMDLYDSSKLLCVF